MSRRECFAIPVYPTTTPASTPPRAHPTQDILDPIYVKNGAPIHRKKTKNNFLVCAKASMKNPFVSHLQISAPLGTAGDNTSWGSEGCEKSGAGRANRLDLDSFNKYILYIGKNSTCLSSTSAYKQGIKERMLDYHISENI